MRLLPVSLFCAFLSSVVIAEYTEKVVGISEVPGDITKEESPAEDIPQPTIFNGIEVPPLLEIKGEKFNSTVKDGYWFVKHHS
jgi:protein disulfide-isomerase